MKETYKVKPPKHITIGDPWYFDKFTGDELKRLTVDEDIPPHLTEARVVLEEYLCDEMMQRKNSMTASMEWQKQKKVYIKFHAHSGA